MGAARKRYGWARCRNSMFVSKLQEGGYTGAAWLPPPLLEYGHSDANQAQKMHLIGKVKLIWSQYLV